MRATRGQPSCPRCGQSLSYQKLGLVNRFSRAAEELLGAGQQSRCDICKTTILAKNRRWRCIRAGCIAEVCRVCATPPGDLPLGLKEGSQHATPLARESSTASSTPDGPQPRKACKYGIKCFRKNPEHLESFVHPGDRDYRMGRLTFADGQQPEFETLWDIFTFCDPDESGHLTPNEFAWAVNVIDARSGSNTDIATAWMSAGGEDSGHLNFHRFSAWATRAGAPLPVGLDAAAGAPRACRFAQAAQFSRCACREFRPSADGRICECGHKDSQHRSDAAEQCFEARLAAERPAHWESEAVGLVPVSSQETLKQLQRLIDTTHKKEDNWTRDRGCAQHGVNGCDSACVYKNKAPVPKGYRLLAAYQNQNPQLWSQFCLTRTAISRECENGGCIELAVETSKVPISVSEPLQSQLNEWHLLHGSSYAACVGICENNFQLSFAGTGATWKDKSKDRGTPLYGYGIYCAESITKADEYAQPSKVPSRGGAEVDMLTVVVCRVIGGRGNVCTTNEFSVDDLRQQVFKGPYHSVFGDRVVSLKKPFREIVVYDKAQCYPEFLLAYARIWEEGRGPPVHSSAFTPVPGPAAAPAEPEDEKATRDVGELAFWEPAWNIVYGRWYYEDRFHGKTSWERPPGCLIDLPTKPPSGAPSRDWVKKLPVDWEAVWDTQSGRCWYYNRRSGERSWVKPTDKVTIAEYVVGTYAEYLSTSTGQWLPCTVVAADSTSGAVQVDVRPGMWIQRSELDNRLRCGAKTGGRDRAITDGASGDQVRRGGRHKTWAAPEVARPRVAIGDALEYYSEQSGTWCGTRVTQVDDDANLVTLELRPGMWFLIESPKLRWPTRLVGMVETKGYG